MQTESTNAEISIDGLYRIATVSQLTGISVPTIRVWESRHAVVEPTRSAGTVRLYRRSDIERLLIVKTAVNGGQAINTVAALTDLQIRARFKVAPALVARTKPNSCRVLVLGSALSSLLEVARKARTDIRVQASWLLLADTSRAAAPPVDAAIIDTPVLRYDLPAALRALRSAIQAPVIIVVYGLGGSQVLAMLDHTNVVAVTSPAHPPQLARICQLGLAIDPTAPAAFSQMLMHPEQPADTTMRS